ncbi:hypothetical protein J14TS2_18350 [Bacillus sp. J14TS2]|nr:hypothetical protein J14TS2_18350 [Bacillus sp. J14TS2]
MLSNNAIIACYGRFSMDILSKFTDFPRILALSKDLQLSIQLEIYFCLSEGFGLGFWL